MKLYEINSELISLLDRLEPDPETGEVPADYFVPLNSTMACLSWVS